MNFKDLLRLNEDIVMQKKIEDLGKNKQDGEKQNFDDYIKTDIENKIKNGADFSKVKDWKKFSSNMKTIADAKGMDNAPKDEKDAEDRIQSEVLKQMTNEGGENTNPDATVQAEKEIDEITKQIQENVTDALSPAARKMILKESFKDIDFDYNSIVNKLDKCFKEFLNHSENESLDKNSEKIFEEIFNDEFNILNVKFDVKYGRSGNCLVDSAYHDPKTDLIVIFIGYGYFGEYLGYREDLGKNRYECFLSRIATTIMHEMTHRYQHSKFRNRSAKDMYDVDKEHFDMNEWKKSKDEIGAQAVEYANIFNNNDKVSTGTFGGQVFQKLMMYQHDDKLRHEIIKKMYPMLNARGKKSFDDFYSRYLEYCKDHPEGIEL